MATRLYENKYETCENLSWSWWVFANTGKSRKSHEPYYSTLPKPTWVTISSLIWHLWTSQNVSTLVELQSDDVVNSWTVSELQSKIGATSCRISRRSENKIYKMLHHSQNFIGKTDFDIGKASISLHNIKLKGYTQTCAWPKPHRFSDLINRE